MLPRAVAEGRRIARNIHRLGRLYLTKSVYAAFLITAAAIFGFTFPFLPRQLTVAAFLTIGIPSFVLALAPSEGPLYRGRLLRALAAFAVPAGIAMGVASLLSFFFVDSVFGGTLEEGRTAATTTLIVLGLCFIVLLERGPGTRAHQRSRATCWRWSRGSARSSPASSRSSRCATSSSSTCSPAGSGSWPCSASRSGSGSPARPGGCPTCSGSSSATARSSTPPAPDRPTRPRTGEFEAVDRGADHGRADGAAAARMSHRRTKIVATIGPATRTVEMMAELIDAGADVFRLNFSHGTRAEHAENVAWPARPRSAAARRSASSATCPGPKLRIDDVEDGIVGLRPGSRDHADHRRRARQRGAALGLLGRLPEAVEPGSEVYLADGRIRLRVIGLRATTRSAARSRSAGGSSSHQGINLPGARVGLPAAGREDLAWVDFAVEQEIDLLAVSFVRRRRGPRAGRAAGAHQRRRHPGDREDREAAGRRARRGDRQGGHRRDHGRPRRPRDRAARSSRCRGVQKRLLALAGRYSQAVDHRDPDARLDGRLAAADAGRGHRRRQRDLPGHRRGDALRGDRGRRVPGRGGAGDGPDRARDRARPALRRLGLQPRRARTRATSPSSVARAAVGSTYTLGLAAIVVPTRSGRTARLVSAHRPRVPVLAVSPRIETVRRLNLLFGVQCAHRRGLDRAHGAARRLRPARARDGRRRARAT